MTRRRLWLAVAGLLVGCGAALGALLAIGGEEQAAITVATTTTAPEASPVTWVANGEVALGPSVLVVEGLTVEDGEAVLSYALFDLNPAAPGRLREPDGLTEVPLQRLSEEAAVAPEAWTLLTAAGEIPGTTSGPRSRTARFSLPGGVLPEVLGLRLDRYWIRLPYSYEIGVPAEAAVALDEGYSLSIGRVIEQTDSTIVQVDLAIPGGFAYGGDPGALLLSVLGEGWTFTSGRTSTGLQLVHEAGPLPDPVRFTARSAYWVPFDRPVEIDPGVLHLG
jgi:hypothetical protein